MRLTKVLRPAEQYSAKWTLKFDRRLKMAMSSKRFFPISLQIFILAFGVSVVMTLVTSIIAYKREVSEALNELDRDLDLLFATMVPNLSEAIWQVNHRQTEMLFSSLKSFDSVTQAYLFNDKNEKISKLTDFDALAITPSQFGPTNVIETEDIMFRKWPVVYRYGNLDHSLGSLVIVVNKKPILREARTHFYLFMFYQMLGILTVSIGLFWFVKKVYVRRTKSLSEYLQGLTLNQFLVTPETLETLNQMSAKPTRYFDEIDQQLSIVKELLLKIMTKDEEVKVALNKVEELNSQLISASTTVSSGQLAVGLVHDINNIVMAISGNVMFLESDIAKMGDPKLFQNLTNLKKQIASIASIIKVQQSSARDQGHLGMNKMRDVIDDAILIEKRRFQRYQVQIQDHTLGVHLEFWGHRAMVLSTLINLFKNAVEAMQEAPGPRILSLHLQTDGNFCYLAVRDNGPGVPLEIRQRLFKFGFTTKAEGHGFGLHSCRENLHRFGADLYLELGRVSGASFTIKLPLSGNKVLPNENHLGVDLKKVNN